jgi:hypothetical protein
MFTDMPVTPARLEVFVDLAWEMRNRKFDRSAIRLLLQPQGLPGLTTASRQALDVLKCAEELELVSEESDGNFRPGWNVRKTLSAREIVLKALDEKVLSSSAIEPWFAKFYAFLIAQDDDVARSGNDAGQQWANEFNQKVFGGAPSENPFNSTKYTGLRRWLRYSGLGWHDSEDGFVPCPYERVRRKLFDVFKKKRRLSSDEFMGQLAGYCPELDGGEIFLSVIRNRNVDRICTRALATALRDLHDDGVIRLDCPADSRGWRLDLAGVVRNPSQGLHSDIFDFVELVTSTTQVEART